MKLRSYVAILFGAFTLTMSQAATATAGGKNHDDGNGEEITLSDLAGTTAETGRGSIVLCFDPSTKAGVACGTAGALVVPYTYVAVGPVIRDADGNACGSFIETLSNIPPDATPPLVNQFQVGAKTTSYDPATATGDCSFTSFTGAKCAGAVATGGTISGTGTCHFTASEGGRRIDYILTTLPGVGAFSISGFDHRE